MFVCFLRSLCLYEKKRQVDGLTSRLQKNNNARTSASTSLHPRGKVLARAVKIFHTRLLSFGEVDRAPEAFSGYCSVTGELEAEGRKKRIARERTTRHHRTWRSSGDARAPPVGTTNLVALRRSRVIRASSWYAPSKEIQKGDNKQRRDMATKPNTNRNAIHTAKKHGGLPV